MSKYYVYHCSVSEIDVEENKVSSVLEAHTDDSKVVPNTKEAALSELRQIIDSHCVKSLTQEIERLNRVVAAMDRRLANASAVSV